MNGHHQFVGYAISHVSLAREAGRVRGCPIFAADRPKRSGKAFAARVGILVFALLTLASAQQTTLRAHAEVNRNGHRLKDASQVVVWLTPIGTPVDPPKQTEIPKLVQKDKAFHPSLLVIPVGGKVEFPNEDPFFHSIYSTSPADPFDIGFYDTGPGKEVPFPNAGIIDVHCHIHASMHATIIVADGPYAQSANGAYTLSGVPAGKYELHAWDLAHGDRTMTIDVPNEAADLTIDIRTSH